MNAYILHSRPSYRQCPISMRKTQAYDHRTFRPFHRKDRVAICMPVSHTPCCIYSPPCHKSRPYLLLKYQLKANALISVLYGVGTSPNPGLATGCRIYTALHTRWCTSKYRGTNTNADIHSLGLQGVAYGFDASIGLSLAASMAFLRVASSAGAREGLEGAGESAEFGVALEAGAMLRFAVISKSWASMLSVRELGRERVRFRVRWKARRSCLRFAEREDADGAVRMERALLRRVVRVCFGEDAAGESAEVESGVVGRVSEEGDSSDKEPFWRSLRVARRSLASLEAPVAKRTRSGSTWNMSPGLSWYPG